jgi:glycosyltransferase involved in cell wall biosynthesis
MWASEIWGVDTRAADDYRRLGRSVNVMPYYADLTTFKRIGRKQFGDPPRFLYAGKLVERKGVDILIAAARSLLQRGAAFHLTVTGDGPLRNELSELRNTYPDNIEYLGFKEIEEMPEVFGRADVLLCPSRYDGWGMVVPEAMASGMPVIASSDTGAALEMVSPGVDGWIVHSGSVDALVTAIDGAIDSADSIPAMSEKARAAASGYDAEAGARHLDELLDGVL